MTNRNITVVLTGGGTGGHIYPAIAVAQGLKLDKDVQKIYYIGCLFNMEKDIAKKENIEFLPISISGMPRKTGLEIIKWYVNLNKAVIKSIEYLYRIKPNVVLGTGGYVSGPVLIASAILGIPFVIHESDARPGIVNRFMSPFAKAITIAFEQAKPLVNSKNVYVNGNPIRTCLSQLSREQALIKLGLNPDKKTLLIMGGSQGAKTINNAMLHASSQLIGDYSIQIIHQTGRKNFDEYTEKLEEIWPNFSSCKSYIVRPYFEDMSAPLAASDLAVARAGSLSISELNLSELPSILVPYPFAAADHQRYNALAMENAGAALMLEDSKCNQESIIKYVCEILQNQDRLKFMKEANKKLSKPDATYNLIEILKKFAR